MSGPVTRRGSAEYNRTVSYSEKRLHDKIKLHTNAAKDIEMRGNPSGAKFPRAAAALHKNMAKNYAKKSNKLGELRSKDFHDRYK